VLLREIRLPGAQHPYPIEPLRGQLVEQRVRQVVERGARSDFSEQDAGVQLQSRRSKRV